MASKYEKRISFIDFTKGLPIDITEGSKLLERDVITPIYSGDKIEEHRAEPTPIQFLVVPPGVTFEFLVIIDQPRIRKILDIIRSTKPIKRNTAVVAKRIEEYVSKPLSQINVGDILKKIREDITSAITLGFSELGLGAKTSSGYGIFEILKYYDI